MITMNPFRFPVHRARRVVVALVIAGRTFAAIQVILGLISAILAILRNFGNY
jgi:hypothetical protein